MAREIRQRRSSLRFQLLVSTPLGRLCLALALAIPALTLWTGVSAGRAGVDGGVGSLLRSQPGAGLSLLLFCAWLLLSLRLLQRLEAMEGAESDAEDAPEASQEPVAAERATDDSTRSILLVDDNAVNRRVAALMLAKAGYRVEEARDGREAVEMVAAGGHGLVLLDIHMPRMNGYEAVAAIRAFDGPDAHVPVLAMTASAMAGDVDRCLEAGMNGYVSKPVRALALLAAVESWFDGTNSPGGEMEKAVHILTPSGAKTDFPTLSMEQLEELRAYGGDEGDAILVELGETFMQGARERLNAMVAAFAKRDRHELERSAHTLKGSAGTLGALKLQEMCRVLEESARTGEFPETREPLEAVQAEVEAVREALNLQIHGLAV